MIRLINRVKRFIPYRLKVAIMGGLPEPLREKYDRARDKEKAENKASLSNVQNILSNMTDISAETYFRSLNTETSEVREHVPGVAVIEINDSCNLDCAMCRTSLAARPKGMMDLDLFEKVVKKLSQRGAKKVSLHTIGDPLANRNIGLYLDILRRHNMSVPRFSTNAQLLKRHMDTVFEYRDVIQKIRPSIDAASKDVYERIRIGGDWDNLHDNLKAFAERNSMQRNPFPVDVDNIVSKDNFHEIAFIPSVFSYLAPAHKFGFHPINSLAPDGNEYFLRASYFDEHLLHHPCAFPWNYLGILKDGRYTTCHRDYEGELAFGDSSTDDPGEAYNSDFMRGLRRAHLNGKKSDMPSMCQKCMVVDPRLGTLLNAIIHYFYIKVQKPPEILQEALNQIGPALNRKLYTEVLVLVRSL